MAWGEGAWRKRKERKGALDDFLQRGPKFEVTPRGWEAYGICSTLASADVLSRRPRQAVAGLVGFGSELILLLHKPPISVTDHAAYWLVSSNYQSIRTRSVNEIYDSQKSPGSGTTDHRIGLIHLCCETILYIAYRFKCVHSVLTFALRLTPQ